MKLLFDQNLSPKLTSLLNDAFPDSSHVSLHRLDSAEAMVVWEFAREQGFAIVTKDADFPEFSVRLGFPPKVIWLRLGNCATQTVEAVLRSNRANLEAFDADAAAGVLSILP